MLSGVTLGLRCSSPLGEEINHSDKRALDKIVIEINTEKQNLEMAESVSSGAYGHNGVLFHHIKRLNEEVTKISQSSPSANLREYVSIIEEYNKEKNEFISNNTKNNPELFIHSILPGING